MWQLSVSTTKCCILDIEKPASNITLSINGVDLPNHSTVRDLGVFVNDSLSPQSHISKVTVTANQRVNVIMCAFVSRDQSTLVRTYCTYVRPILIYNCVIWSPSNLGDNT